MYENDISIIVPTYNNEKTITRLLISINLYLRSFNVDLVLVDDGSKDNTVLLEEKFDFSENIHTKIIRSSHSGVSIARNIGIQHANGKYLMFIDGDDEIDEQIQSLLKDFESFHSQIISFSMDTLNIHDGQKMIGNSIADLSLSMLLSKWKGVSPNEYEMSASNKLYLTEFIRSNDIRFDKNLKCWEDLFFNMSILQKAKSVFMKKGTIFKYNHDNLNSVTHKKSIVIIEGAKYVYKNSSNQFTNPQINRRLLKVEEAYFISHIVGGYFVFNSDKLLYNDLLKVIPLRKETYKYSNTLHHKFILWGLYRLGFKTTILIYKMLKKMK